MGDFDGRIVVVTGAASGIGWQTAHEFASRGARVAGVDLGDSVIDRMAELPGAAHRGIVADLTDSASPDSVADDVVRAFGKIDVLVNSAGIAALSPALELSVADWNRTIAVNLTASFRMAQAVARVMVPARYGRIISLASQAGVIGLDQHAAYAASKAGLIGLTRVLSLEWAPHGVTVNTVSPTVVETPLGKAAWSGERGDAMRALIPAGRFAQPDEVSGLIAYLASERAGMITGENILIDGGYSSV